MLIVIITTEIFTAEIITTTQFAIFHFLIKNQRYETNHDNKSTDNKTTTKDAYRITGKMQTQFMIDNIDHAAIGAGYPTIASLLFLSPSSVAAGLFVQLESSV